MGGDNLYIFQYSGDEKENWKKITEEELSKTGDEFRNTLRNTPAEVLRAGSLCYMLHTNTTSTKSSDTATEDNTSFLCGHLIQSACCERQIRALTSADEQPFHKPHTVTHFQIGSLSEKMTSSSSEKVTEVKAGWKPVPSKLRLPWQNGYYTLYEGLLWQKHRELHPSSHPSAGLIEHPITDRWTEQIMERSISVTSYRLARYVIL